MITMRNGGAKVLANLMVLSPLGLLFCLLMSLQASLYAGPRDNPGHDMPSSLDEIILQSAAHEDDASQPPLDGRVSMDELLRLRRDLDEYSRVVDPAHVQIEERRHLMRKRLQERFQSADKDNNNKISREEATEFMPQIARHFSRFDLNGDGVITLDELVEAQTRELDRQRAINEKMQNQAEPAQENEKAKNTQAAVVRKSALQ